MKPVMRKLSPDTKVALQAQFEHATRRAQKHGYDAGWDRGFRVGALFAFAACSTLGLVIGGIAWAVG